ncbi:hypothetical protein [Pelistega sp. MC2]|uniref:hypothetical protein n=1 Tax=Pelistega sp. MC2 TaxID=1720297 RepID=UPI0008D948F7|nr:hypothetical protein [Pelistega sp. MC2]
MPSNLLLPQHINEKDTLITSKQTQAETNVPQPPYFLPENHLQKKGQRPLPNHIRSKAWSEPPEDTPNGG